MLVAVGSTNQTKIDPVSYVFLQYFQEVSVQGIHVLSGVSEQPTSEEEMFIGARNRARNAFSAMKDAEYGVGIEGGIHKYSFGWMERSLVVIVNQHGKIGIGSSGGLVLPQSFINYIEQGKTLEEAVDLVCGTTVIGEGIGMFGLMTNRVVTRSEGVRHGVAFALARFIHPELY